MRMSQPGPHGQASMAPWRRWLFPVAIMASLVALLTVAGGAPRGVPLTYTQFVADVGAGMVRAVTIGPAGQVSGTLAGGHLFTTTIPVALGGNTLAADLAAHHVQVSATTGMSSPLLSVLLGLLPLLLIGGLLFMFVRTTRQHAGGPGGLGGAAGLAKAKARVIADERPATRFADVAGYPAVKTEITEVVEYLRDPARYHRAGARGPRGVLMAGPPGTGKTLLARAVAGEAQVPFLSVVGSSFVEMFVGVGAARVRDLFERARTLAPAIIFIDEIDALGGRRDHSGLLAGLGPQRQRGRSALAHVPHRAARPAERAQRAGSCPPDGRGASARPSRPAGHAGPRPDRSLSGAVAAGRSPPADQRRGPSPAQAGLRRSRRRDRCLPLSDGR
jgi:cell division protease FtsH